MARTLPISLNVTILRNITAMKRAWVVSVSISVWAAAAYAAGPTQLVRSTPADGSVGANPTNIVLEFSEPVHFSRAFLKKDGGKAEALRDLPQKEATTQTISTAALGPGHYVLQWEVFTGHTTIFSSHIQFTVSADQTAARTGSQ
jgi:methionine-rich copper-binding protein CopC